MPHAALLNRWLLHPAVKPLVFGLALLPFLYLVAAIFLDRLGANPAQALIRSLGDWALRLLCAVLALTPLRTALGLSALARWRRMLGLFVAWYALWHLLAYAWLDMGLDLGAIARDVGKRPFILVGMLAGLLLAILAATSLQRAVRWLGGRRWQAVHRSVYAVACLAVLHFYWMRASKNDTAQVLWYALVLGSLLAWRAVRALAQKKP